MVIPRASARWTPRLFNRSVRTASRPSRTWSWQQVQRRAYASEGGGHGGKTQSRLAGDLPWLIGATVVTVPSTWYLMQPQIERWNRPKGSGHGGHGHGEAHHDEHGEESEGGEEGDKGDKGGDGDEGGEGQSKEVGEEGENPDDSGSEGEQESTPNTSEDEGSEDQTRVVDSGKNVEGVQFKGAVAGGTKGNNEQGDTRKSFPDAKGGKKKRIESDYGKKEGEAQKPEQDPKSGDKAAASKGVDDPSFSSQSGKQEGLSNTDTKHPELIADNPEKSTKGEGGPESAKNKGTVDPRRPQAENKEKRGDPQ